MKLKDDRLEICAIKSMLSGKAEIGHLLLGSLNEDHFFYEPAKAAFHRTLTLFRRSGKLISFSELLSDPALDEDYREDLREYDWVVCKSVDRVKILIEQLNKYRSMRHLYYMSKHIVDSLNKNAVDLDLLHVDIANRLTEAKVGGSIDKHVRTLGKNGNAINLAKTVLNSPAALTYKTGFHEFDQKDGGLPAVGVLLIAATTSGGKSVALMNLLLNIYKINQVSVCNVSLEMSQEKLVMRIMSRETKIPFFKFKHNRLNEEEKVKARNSWKKLHNYGVENDCVFSTICPEKAGLDSIFSLVKPYGFKVVGIDYSNLLEDVDNLKSNQTQAGALSSVLRRSKIFAEENNCLVIILAQLDQESGKIRYSRAMEEHADNVWTWSYVKDQRNGIIPVEQRKSRDGELLTFELKELFEVMTIANPEDEIKICGEIPQSIKEKTFDNSNDFKIDDHPDIEVDTGQK